MAWKNRMTVDAGSPVLKLVVAQKPEDSHVAGRVWTRAGWYWWLTVDCFPGHELSGVIQGPHATEGEALRAGNQWLTERLPGNDWLRVWEGAPAE